MLPHTANKNTINITTEATAARLPAKWQDIYATNTSRRNLQHTNTIEMKEITVSKLYCELQRKYRNAVSGSFSVN